jgi:hypothetical protein
LRFPPELALRSTGCTCRQINRLLSTGVKCFGAKSTRTIYSSYPHPRAESSFITHNRLRLSLHSSSLVRSTRRYRHDTDVYPRENGIAPESGICVGTYMVSMTIPTREMHIAHKRDTGEMGGRGQGCGRVIDLHLPTGREGGRRTRWTLGATPPSTRCRPAHLYGQDQESGCSSHPPRVCSSRFRKVWMWRARRSPRFLIFYVSGEKSI